MTQAQLGLLIGGLIPAFLFGFAGICQKLSSQQGLSSGLYVTFAGLGVLLTGLTLMSLQGMPEFNLKSIWPALSMGVAWALGILLVVYAITHYNAPLSKLAPLYNMNTLVTVIGALIIFSEWKDANVIKLLLGSVLIVGGGILVSS